MACKEVELLHVRQDRRANVVDSVNAEVGVMRYSCSCCCATPSHASSLTLPRSPHMDRQLEHTNIVKFLGCRPREGKLYIFSEWMSGGSLASIVKNIGALDEAVVQHYVRDILRGLVAVHQADFVHGDIKVRSTAVYLFFVTTPTLTRCYVGGCDGQIQQQISLAMCSWVVMALPSSQTLERHVSAPSLRSEA